MEKKYEILKQLTPAQIQQIVKERDDYRVRQVIKSLNQLGFTFANTAEEHKFIGERLTLVKAKDSPGIQRIYLDHEEPKEEFLAEYNNNPDISNGQILFHDFYSCQDEVA